MYNQWSGVLKMERPVVNMEQIVKVSSRCSLVNRTEPLDRGLLKIFGRETTVFVKAHINPHGLLLVDSGALPKQEW